MPELIDRYARIALPYLDDFPPNSCIEQTRLLRECLGRFGAAVTPIETHLTVLCLGLKVMYEAPEHVVALIEIEGEYFLTDAALSQASVHDRGLVIERNVQTVGPLPVRLRADHVVAATGHLKNGLEVKVSWRVKGTRSFETTPAWEPSHLWLLIRQIVREMERAESVADGAGVRVGA